MLMMSYHNISVICEETQLKKTDKEFFFDGSDNQIKEIIGTSNVSIHTMICSTLHAFPSQSKDVNIVILIFMKYLINL